MFFILFYIIILILLIRNGEKSSVFKRVLYYSYLISAVAGLALLFIVDDSSYISRTESYLPLLFLLFIIILWTEPYSKLLSIESVESHDPTSYKYFSTISSIVCCYFFPITVLLCYNAIRILTTVDVSLFRLEADYNSYFIGGPFFSLSVYSSMLCFVPHFLFFLSYQYNVGFLKRFTLLFCSFSFAFMTLCFAGRDGIVYWLMNSIVFYLFFRKSYHRQEQKKIKGIFLIAGIFIVTLLGAITFIRFIIGGQTDSDSIFYPILDYMGQQIHIFCQTASLTTHELSQLDNTDYLTSTFATFVGAFIHRYGYIGTILISIAQVFVVLFFTRIFLQKRDLWDFFIVYLFYQVPLYGVFYYRQSIQSMELVYFIALLLFVLLKTFKIKIIRI